MHFHHRRIAVVAACLGAAFPAAHSALAGPPMESAKPRLTTPLTLVADTGINIVRMPPKGSPAGQAQGQAGQTPPPSEVAKSQGKLLKLPVKVGSQPSDTTKGWLGTRLDAIEAPLAGQLGIEGGNGALILETVAGGPANQSGLRFGDIVVALNGRPIAGANDLFRRVSSVVPGG